MSQASDCIRHYVRNDFGLDFVCAFPYPWLGWAFNAQSLEAGALSMLRVLFTLLPLARTLRCTFLPTYSSVINPGLDRLTVCLLILIFACHWAGCIWWLVSVQQVDNMPQEANKHWGPSPWLCRQPISIQYLHAFLWGVRSGTKSNLCHTAKQRQIACVSDESSLLHFPIGRIDYQPESLRRDTLNDN